MFSGKIVDIERRTTQGFARGTVILEHITDPDRVMRIEIQNEYLIAFENDVPVLTVPDLIASSTTRPPPPSRPRRSPTGSAWRSSGCPVRPSGTSPGCSTWSAPARSAMTSSTCPSETRRDERSATRHRRRWHQHRRGRGGWLPVPCWPRRRSPPPPSPSTASGAPSRASSGGSTRPRSPRRCWAPPTPPTPSSSASGLDRVGMLRLAAPVVPTRSSRGCLAGGPASPPSWVRPRSSTVASSTTAARSRRSTTTRSSASPPSAPGRSGRSPSPAPSARPPSTTSSAPSQILAEELGDAVAITLSHEIGSLGLLEREDATALNASLLACLRRGRHGLARAHGQRPGRHAYLTQNDGTLMSAELAVKFPILTVGSGPTNSMRGASALAGLRTRSSSTSAAPPPTSASSSTVSRGSPATASRWAACAPTSGCRTSSPSASAAAPSCAATATVKVGPDSVGYRVVTEALVMGGSVPTLSDVSVKAGRLSGFGDAGRRAA